MTLIIFTVIVFLSRDLKIEGKSAALRDHAFLLSGPENKDDSNKKERQLLFHFISIGKSSWGQIQEL